MAVEINIEVDLLSLEVPAPYVNKFQILASGGTLRVAFAEAIPNISTNYRSAVVMNLEDARELAEAILRTLPSEGPKGALSGAIG